MADGSGPSMRFNFPLPQLSRLRLAEIIIDLFAGGGGASEALKQAIGADPALAYNHDVLAIGMHAANHPLTQHHREDIWHADPRRDVDGRPVGWFHASPDCTHFSQAKGGQPRSRRTRALSWVVLKWVGQLRRADQANGTNTAPRIISMENVWQILTWGPLVAKRCKETGRVIKMDGTVAARGERVPVENQQLVPDKRHSGRTWRQFVAALRALGYVVEWRKLVASDYGAGTSRERLFLLARRDGEPIMWPKPSHGSAPGQTPRVTAADCLDFSDLGRSIFGRKKDLAEATMRRIAKGIMRHVINSADPFIVPVTHQGGDRVHSVREPMRTITAANRGELMLAAPELAPFITEHANASNQRTMPADEPLRTVCAGVKGGHFSMVAPTLVQTGYGEREGQAPRSLDLQQPLGTVVAGGVKHAVAAAHLVKFRGDSIGSPATEPIPTITSGAGAARPAGAAHALGLAATCLVQMGHGEGKTPGKRFSHGINDIRGPIGTIVASGGGQGVMTAFLEQANGGFYQGDGNDARDPVSTITASGSQQRLVSADLTKLAPEHEAGALRVAAFLIKYYGSGIAVDPRDPLDTVTTKDRLALVTVVIQGTPYVIVDIKLRMLKPQELFRAQGFPANYIIDRTADGTVLKTTAQVRMCGNSVSPPPFYALIDANLDPVAVPLAGAA